MKKKLLLTATAIACTLSCSLALTACGGKGSSDKDKNKEPDPYGITAESCKTEAVEAKSTATGWKLTDTKVEDKTEKYCVDIYIYNSDKAPYTGMHDIYASDFTVSSVSPDSIKDKGEEEILSIDNTFEDYYERNKAKYTVSATPTVTGDKETGYTEVTTTKYSRSINVLISKADYYVQRCTLIFDTEINPANLKYKGEDVGVLDSPLNFPSYYTYAVTGNLSMCVIDEVYKVEYSKTTQTFKTKVEKDYTETKNMITLSGVKYGVNVDTYIEAEGFKLETGGKFYKAKGFYTGKKEVSDLVDLYQDHKDDFPNTKDYRDLTYDYEEFTFAAKSNKIESISLYFEELTEIPANYKIIYYTRDVIEV